MAPVEWPLSVPPGVSRRSPKVWLREASVMITRVRVRIALAILAIVLGSLLSGCGRPDPVGSHEAHAKAELLGQDPMFRSPLDGVPPLWGIPLLEEAHVSDGWGGAPSHYPTKDAQIWRDAAFGPDLRTFTELVTYAAGHGVGSFGPPTCSYSATGAPIIWYVGGWKQYGDWVAGMTLSAMPGQSQIDADMGMGDDRRGTVAQFAASAKATAKDNEKYANAPHISTTCPAAAVRVLLSLTQRIQTKSTPSLAVAPSTTPSGSDTTPSGVSFEELRRLNLRYADRDPFSGDGPGILKDQARVRAALKVLAKPTEANFRAALIGSGFSSNNIGTSNNAVRMAGVAFAVTADGGCIFGSSYEGVLTVDVGGYINDGGCLASYGH